MVKIPRTIKHDEVATQFSNNNDDIATEPYKLVLLLAQYNKILVLLIWFYPVNGDI